MIEGSGTVAPSSTDNATLYNQAKAVVSRFYHQNIISIDPAEEKEVDLVAFGGTQRIFGFNALTEAQINDTTIAKSTENAKLKGFIK